MKCTHCGEKIRKCKNKECKFGYIHIGINKLDHHHCDKIPTAEPIIKNEQHHVLVRCKQHDEEYTLNDSSKSLGSGCSKCSRGEKEWVMISYTAVTKESETSLKKIRWYNYQTYKQH